MQHFAGLHKKTIAGISCALAIFLLPLTSTSFADDTAATLINSQTALTNIQTDSANHKTIPISDAAPDANVNSPSASAPISTPNLSANAPVNTPKPATQKVSSSSQLASLLGGLVLIIVLIYGLSWFVKRFAQGGFMHNPSMKIVSALPLGTRERLMLVDVCGKQLLLGVTATQINTLHVFDGQVVQTESPQPVASDFSQKLMAILQQKNFSPDDGAHKK